MSNERRDEDLDRGWRTDGGGEGARRGATSTHHQDEVDRQRLRAGQHAGGD